MLFTNHHASKSPWIKCPSPLPMFALAVNQVESGTAKIAAAEQPTVSFRNWSATTQLHINAAVRTCLLTGFICKHKHLINFTD